MNIEINQIDFKQGSDQFSYIKKWFINKKPRLDERADMMKD